MRAPAEQPGGGAPRAAVDGARVWAGGAATTLVVVLVVLLGVLISRVAGVPGLAGDETGTLATALLFGYAVMWSVTTLLLTGVLHLVLLIPRPLRLFAWIAAALVLVAVVAPLTAGTTHASALAVAAINLVAGGTAGVLLLRVGRAALQDGRGRYLASPAGGATRVRARAGQAGARRPRR